MTATLWTGVSFTAIAVIVGVLGSWVLWHVNRHTHRRNAEAEAEMARAFEPYGSRRHGFTTADELHQPPLLPDDYRNWNP